ncbi:MAG TPA: anti-sigma factor [Phenylobacterium sp.]|jgi:hypothetical protein|nr:anti-sigma factor [Phenylobacterium sp.]
MTPSPEIIAAYVDGELSPQAVAAFEAGMNADPGLVAEVARQRALRARLAVAFGPVLTEEIPLALRMAATVANDPQRPRAGLPQWAALAACLVVGVAIGQSLSPPSGSLVSEHGTLVARAGLARALTTQLAADGGAVKVGLTFRDAGGGFCRTFLSRADRLAGLACRRDNRWIVQTASAWAPPQVAPQYRTAASETPPAVLAAVDGVIAGAPLDAAAERAARDAGWGAR